MERKEFLEQVRDAVRGGQQYRLPLTVSDEVVGYVGDRENLCQQLAARVEAVGGIVHSVDDAESARLALGNILSEVAPASVLCWQHPLLEELTVADLLRERQIEVQRYDELAGLPEPERRERILGADVGISSVDVAVAETGSLVVCSQPGQERLASLAPPVHIAIVEAEQIVPDLYDVFTKLAEAGVDNLPSNLAFITGPSKTGDIELQLTTGVHGPGTWHVIILDR